MTDQPDIPQDDEVLAAELALRLLDGEDAEAARRRAMTDRAFADRVAFWNARFADLTEELGAVSPGDRVKRDLMERLFAEHPSPSEVGTSGVSAIWRWIGLVGMAASAALLAVLLYFPMATDTVYVAEIVSEDGSFRYLAVIDTNRDTMRLVRTDGQPPADGTMELWGHGADDPPVSFGVIPSDPRIAVPVPEVLKEDVDQLTIAVSNEPEGGSPTGQPTGAVLAAGESTGL